MTDKRYTIAYRGAVIGELTLGEIKERWKRGELAGAHYLHPCQQWKSVAPLVVPKIEEDARAARLRAEPMARPPANALPIAPEPKRWSTATVVVLMCLGSFVVLFLLAGVNQPGRPRPILTAAERQEIAHLARIGAVRLDAPAHSAWVDPLSWFALDVQQKEGLSARLAYFVEAETGSRWIVIYDKMSGHKLAKYSGAWGFSVY